MIRLNARQDNLPSAALRLEGNKALLKSPTVDDWREWSLLRQESRAFLTPWEPLWAVDSLTEAFYQRRLRRIGQEWRDDEGYTFHVFDRMKGQLIGGIGLTQVKRGISQSGVIGYWVGSRFARQGYLSEATRLVVGFAFDMLGLHRVEANCIPENLASRGLIEKLGFQQEGYARSYLKIAGEWSDHVMYAMVESDWRQQNFSSP